jgi:predicted secreted protein
MGPVTGIAIYLVLWWVVLLGILPLGTQSQHEAGVVVTDGSDPGAPVDPKIGRKFLTTTWVSALIFGVFWAIVALNLIELPGVARTY